MPNGESRNWIRFCAVIEGFRARYKKWPTKVRVPETFIEELQEVLTKESFEKLLSKITLIGDESPYIAEDKEGESYNYGLEGFSGSQPDLKASDWLDVQPDYYD
jgi:hypothetical protein